MKFITHKPTFSKFLITVKFRLRKTNIYLFPQGCGVTEAATKVRIEEDHYRHDNFTFKSEYVFSWLWLDILFETRKKRESTASYIQAPYTPPTKEKECPAALSLKGVSHKKGI